MSYDDLLGKAADLEDKQKEKVLDDQGILANAIVNLLADICFTRFELLIGKGLDPLEAAQDTMENLDRYDFLSNLPLNPSYPELKKQIASNISDQAETVIREDNPR